MRDARGCAPRRGPGACLLEHRDGPRRGSGQRRRSRRSSRRRPRSPRRARRSPGRPAPRACAAACASASRAGTITLALRHRRALYAAAVHCRRADRPHPRLLLARGPAWGGAVPARPRRGTGAARPRGHALLVRLGAGSETVDGVTTVRLPRRGRGRSTRHEADFGRRRAAAPGARRASTPSTRSAATTPWRRSARPGCGAAAARCSPTSAFRRGPTGSDVGRERGAGRREGREAASTSTAACRSARSTTSRSEYGRDGRRGGARAAWTAAHFVPAPSARRGPRSCSRARSTVPFKEVRAAAGGAAAGGARASRRCELWLSGPGDGDAAARGGARRRRASAPRLLGLGEADRQHERYGQAWVDLPAVAPRLLRDGPGRVAGLRHAARDDHRGRAPGAGRSRGGRGSCAEPGDRGGPRRRAASDALQLAREPGDRRGLPATPRSASTGTAASRRWSSASTLATAMTRVLVTGAGGYVGSGLVATLEHEGWEVRAAGRERADAPGRRAGGGRPGRRPGRWPRAACDGVDTVVHLAGDNEVIAARDPAFALGAHDAGHRAAGRGDRRRPGSSASSTCRRCTSTASGSPAAPTLTEDMRPEPRATYAIARLASEHRGRVARPPGPEVVVLRLTNSPGRARPPGGRPVDARGQRPLPPGRRCDGRLELRSVGLPVARLRGARGRARDRDRRRAAGDGAVPAGHLQPRLGPSP